MAIIGTYKGSHVQYFRMLGHVIHDKLKKIMFFPRYHQMDVVRKLVKDVKEKQTGYNYLIKHSAGSGKSKSIPNDPTNPTLDFKSMETVCAIIQRS